MTRSATKSIDLNADLGEGFGHWRLTDDEQLLSVVTSANVACGFHAGDPAIMRRVCALAAERGVRIGAQVSYRDLAGFGRRSMDVPPAELAAEVAYQIGALEVFARAAGSRVSYVKPHGALYNRVVHDEEQAAAVVDGRTPRGRRACPSSGCRAPGCSPRPRRPGCPSSPRRSRTAPTPRRARWCRAAGRAPSSATRTRSWRAPSRWPCTARSWPSRGEPVPVGARSLCVHGDTPGAVELARRVRARSGVGGRPGGGLRMTADALRILPVGANALLIELDSGEAAEALHAELLRRRAAGTLPPVREIVPAARTVLLDGVSRSRRARRPVRTWDIPPLEAGARETVEIAVRYDGPDLADVAALWQVSPQEAVRIHSSAEFRVAFCGFAPGFGYLTGPRASGTPCRAGPLRAPRFRRVRWPWRARTPASIRAPPPAAGS